jgi:hypothetical protein
VRIRCVNYGIALGDDRVGRVSDLIGHVLLGAHAVRGKHLEPFHRIEHVNENLGNSKLARMNMENIQKWQSATNGAGYSGHDCEPINVRPGIVFTRRTG